MSTYHDNRDLLFYLVQLLELSNLLRSLDSIHFLHLVVHEYYIELPMVLCYHL